MMSVAVSYRIKQDYCSVLYMGLHLNSIQRLQLIQNAMVGGGQLSEACDPDITVMTLVTSLFPSSTESVGFDL